MKKITKKKINDYIKMTQIEEDNIVSLSYLDGEDEFVVSIKKTLSDEDTAKFLSMVVEPCFIDDIFHPEYLSSLYKCAFLTCFVTNITIPTSEDEFGKSYDIDKCVEIVDKLDLIDRYVKSGSKCASEKDRMDFLVESKIDFYKECAISKHASKEVLLKLSEFESVINGGVKSISEFLTPELVEEFLLSTLGSDILDDLEAPEVLSKGD